VRVGVVLVHYRTPEPAREAVSALRCSEELGDDLDLVVVDNGSDDAGREILEALPVRLLRPGGNLGYAGGVNLGFAELLPRKPDVLVAMNPDVVVAPSCLAELVRALQTGAGVAGPRFLWGERGYEDEGGARVLLPPADLVGRARELGRFLAESKGGRWARRARAAWRRNAQRHWTATSDLPSHALSGALLAISADAWSRVGPFDEGYRLYFEETDWLRRARKAGVAGRYVPAAVAHHGYARSTARETQAAAWFAASEARFRRRWYGRAFAACLQGLARRSPPRPGDVSDGATGPPVLGPETRWIEVCASPLGLPSGGICLPAGCDPEGDPLPTVVRRRAEEMTLYWRTVDAAGRESGSEPLTLRK
jgi:GT2 family glycosyltransferase